MIENQNIILLILILISVLVAFYALYIGLSNSRKIKKQQQELINIINLIRKICFAEYRWHLRFLFLVRNLKQFA